MGQDPNDETTEFINLFIKVPPTTPWQPATSLTLIQQLVSIPEQFYFVINGLADATWWRICVPAIYEDRVQAAVNSTYPDAEINYTASFFSSFSDDDYCKYSFGYSRYLFFPLKTVTECSQIDPLRPLANVMNFVRGEEIVTYELCALPVDPRLNQLIKQGVKSAFGVSWGTKLLDMILYILQSMVGGGKYYVPPQPTYTDPMIQMELNQQRKIALAKSQQPLRRYRLRVFLDNCHNKNRQQELSNFQL